MKALKSKSLQELVRSTRVLVIEDDHYMRKVIRSLLQANGIRTFHDAQDGASGLEAIISLNPDVVILDWDLPDDDAVTVAGLVIHEAQTIPKVGQTWTFYGHRFQIVRRERNQITSMKIWPTPPREPD